MFKRCLLVLIGALALSTASQAKEPLLVVYDNDFYGPTSADILPLIGSPDVKVLGFTVVTGDGWRDEEAAYLLRSLELYHHTEIPVYLGAVHPLINSADRLRAWEQSHGKVVWKGAWNESSMGPMFHPDEPTKIAALEEGLPTVKAQTESAVTFMIRMVHEHPHQVVILAAGPMTNIALAIRLDPEFAALAKELVFMGALIDTNLGQVAGNTNFNTDFNFIFDPEAAHIALTAPWARITAVGDISNNTMMTKDAYKALIAKKTPVTEVLARHPWALPMWDELAAELMIDRSLITKEVEAYMDVDVDHGLNYGITHVWPEATHPNLGEQKVHVVLDVDKTRFLAQFNKAAQSDLAFTHP
jgi:inosine-uridine nucleoside N-ribohydrolase